MKIVCESCQAKYSIADEKVSGKVFKIRCKRCGEVIVVRGDQEPQGEEATRVYDYAQDAVWHAVINGDQQGPFAPQQLGEMLTAGTLDWDAYVWCEGFDNWLPMRDVPDLVAAITGQGEPSGGMAAAAAAPRAASRPAVDYGAQPSMGADPFADDGGGGGGGGGLFDAPAAAAPDLFGGGGGGSPFDSGRGRVVSSSPSPRVSAEQAMTGARNENSVLFSLKNLQALATGSTSGAASPAAADFGGGGSGLGSSERPGFAAGEGSGLIDIRALASATGMGSSDAGEEKDELLSIGSQTGAFGTLGSPMLAPVAQEDSGNKKMFIWAGVAGVAFLSAAAVAVAFILRPAPQPAAPAVTAAAAVAPVAAPTAPAAPAPNAEDAPSEGELAARAAAAKDEKSDESGSREGSSGGKRRPKSTGGGDAPSAEADSPAGEPAKASAPEPKKVSSANASIDDLLNGALSGSGGAKPKPAAAPAADENLPAKPSRDQVLDAMNGVKGEVQACAQGATGVAFAEVTVSGSTGRVTNAQISGQTGAIGSCIARVVRKAKFPKFREATFQVKFPYRLQ